eukprot:gene8316-14281_t
MVFKIACLLSLVLIATATPVDVNQEILQDAYEQEKTEDKNPIEIDESEGKVMYCVPIEGNAPKSKRGFGITPGRGRPSKVDPRKEQSIIVIMVFKIAFLLSLVLIVTATPVDVNQEILQDAYEQEKTEDKNPIEIYESEGKVMYCVPVEGNAPKSKRAFGITPGRGPRFTADQYKKYLHQLLLKFFEG